MATIYDVAAAAGVSPATVSRVFNGARVSQSKVEAVTAVARELGFVPNMNARRLRLGSSQIIAMLIPDIENTFFTAMTRGVTDVIRAEGYSLMLGNTDDNPAEESFLLAAAVADPVAGVIVVPSNQAASYALPLSRGVPVVTVDREASNDPVDSVIPDDVEAALAGTSDLFAAGFRRVACVSGPTHVTTADLRLEGWAQAWQAKRGARPPEELSQRQPYTIEGGERGAEALLALPDPPDAIVAGNNRLAIGIIRHLMKRGLTPGQIGVLSLGELPLTLYLPEGLYVAALPARQLGVRAAEMLIDRIRGYDGPPRRELLSAARPPVADSGPDGSAVHPSLRRTNSGVDRRS